MGKIDEIGDIDGWRCWLCDETVDPDRSVNDDRGPSIDSRIPRAKAKSKAKRKGVAPVAERLAHRGCNTGKGNITPTVHWPDHLFVGDPAEIIPTVERLLRKGGREAVGRCPNQEDADDAANWLVDRISRLEPGLELTTMVQEGGGQFLVVLVRT